MKIKKILTQHRRDFSAVYECQHCGNTCTGVGYDDSHFHDNVVPAMKCTKCGLAAGPDYQPLATKYPDGEQV